MLRLRRSKTHPTTLVFCVHKGASTFLATEFAPAVAAAFPGLRHWDFAAELLQGRTAEDMRLPSRGVLAARIYPHLYDAPIEDPVPARGRFADKKLILVRRDPRDAAVSLYYSIRYSHGPGTRRPERLQEGREKLSALDRTDGLLFRPAPLACRQFRATNDLLAKYPAVLLTSYEELVGDFSGWIARVGAHLDWPAEQTAQIEAALAGALDPPEREDPSQHKRRVTPGNWREIFDDRLVAYFKAELGDALEAAGYAW